VNEDCFNEFFKLVIATDLILVPLAFSIFAVSASVMDRTALMNVYTRVPLLAMVKNLTLVAFNWEG
jgi:hypothetical protein